MIDQKIVCDVYFNSTSKVWSVRQNGKVVLHCEKMILRDCQYIVSERGRQRVIANKRKNVHAFIRGYHCYVEDVNNSPEGESFPITYNPYTMATFQKCRTGEPVLKSDFADLDVLSPIKLIGINK